MHRRHSAGGGQAEGGVSMDVYEQAFRLLPDTVIITDVYWYILDFNHAAPFDTIKRGWSLTRVMPDCKTLPNDRLRCGDKIYQRSITPVYAQNLHVGYTVYLSDITDRENLIEQQRRKTSAVSLEDLSREIAEGEIKEIPVIIKADVQGSAEAVKSSLEKLDVEGVKVNVIHSTAGAINDGDIMLADASKAMIIGFNVRPTADIRKKAEDAGVEIRLHNIIYKATEEMENAMKGMLDPVYTEVVIGQAEIRETYKVSKIGTIGGCMVTDGKLAAKCGVRLIRDGIVIYTGVLGSLKRFKDDAKEVSSGYECGVTIENYNDLKIGDTIEAYQEQEVPSEG